MSALLEIAERCEQATGHDARLDRDIWLAAIATPHERALVMAGAELHGERESNFRIDWMADGARYTASLDAAMTLVPEGWRAGFEENARCDEPGKSYAWVWPFGSNYDPDWQMGQEGQQSNPDAQKGYAATPALALCAAALRARAASCDRNPTGQDREAGLGAEHESAVGEAETPKQGRP